MAATLSDDYRLFRQFQKVSLFSKSLSLESQEPKAVPNKKEITPTTTAPAEIIFDFLLRLRLRKWCSHSFGFATIEWYQDSLSQLKREFGAIGVYVAVEKRTFQRIKMLEEERRKIQVHVATIWRCRQCRNTHLAASVRCSAHR